MNFLHRSCGMTRAKWGQYPLRKRRRVGQLCRVLLVHECAPVILIIFCQPGFQQTRGTHTCASYQRPFHIYRLYLCANICPEDVFPLMSCSTIHFQITQVKSWSMTTDIVNARSTNNNVSVKCFVAVGDLDAALCRFHQAWAANLPT